MVEASSMEFSDWVSLDSCRVGFVALCIRSCRRSHSWTCLHVWRIVALGSGCCHTGMLL